MAVSLALVVVAAFHAGAEASERLGLSFSLEGLEDLRRWVDGLGWLGPTVFVALVTFRLFLLLSSHVVLILGGLVFGVGGGTLWGALGLVFSALLQFFAARLLGEDWVRKRLADRDSIWEDRIRRLGPAPVFVVGAHPAGPPTPINLAAGLVGLPLWEFTLAVALSAAIRAGTYSVLGTSILTWGPGASIAIALGLVILLVLPLSIPAVRHWVLGTGSRRPVQGG